MSRTVLAALAVSLALPAAAAPADPLSLLTTTLGEAGVETLGERGVLALQGKPGARTLAAVHWKALETFARASPSCLKLAAAADELGREPAPSSAETGFGACRALPAGGPLTPSLAALAAALQARHEERWALARTGLPTKGVPGRPNLFDTPWGRELAARRHADVLEDPGALARLVFEERLAGPRPDKEATALLAAEASARGVSAPEILMAGDAAKGTLSEELRLQLRRTLLDSRRRWNAERARAAAEDILAKKDARRELEELRAAAKALAVAPDLSSKLEAAAARGSSSAGPRLRSAGLHLQEPTRLGQYELGDDAVVSGAYWVDGLPEGKSIDVEESTVLDAERGFLALETKRVSRRNGGPYPYARTLKIGETATFGVRAFVSAGGASAVERIEVPVARDFELALRKEADALALRAACRLKEADQAAESLEALAAEPAKAKPQYKDLQGRTRRLRELVKTDVENAARLEERLAAAREASSPQRCRYETGPADDALKLVRKLPPGCDRDLPELHALRSLIGRRAVDQSWFLKASSEARSKRKSCDLPAARTRWNEALAVLDADPGARCGKVQEEEARAKAELAELAAEAGWREELGKSLSAVEAETSPARRLDKLRAAQARLGALGLACLKPEQKRAVALAEASSKALTAPADAEIRRRLPPDAMLASASADVRAERARLAAAAAAVESAAEEPAKAAAEARAKTAPRAPAAAPERKPAPAKAAARSASRPARKAKGKKP